VESEPADLRLKRDLAVALTAVSSSISFTAYSSSPGNSWHIYKIRNRKIYFFTFLMVSPGGQHPRLRPSRSNMARWGLPSAGGLQHQSHLLGELPRTPDRRMAQLSRKGLVVMSAGWRSSCSEFSSSAGRTPAEITARPVACVYLRSFTAVSSTILF